MADKGSLAGGSGSGTQAVDRAAALVTRVVLADKPVSFTELSEGTGLARSTTSRLLSALERAGLVERDRDGAYLAGPLFARYAARHDAWSDLSRTSQPVLARVRDITGETANLGVPHGDTVIHLAQANSRYVLGPRDWTQIEVPSHSSALGRVLYAYGRLELPEEPLEQLTPHTISGLRQLSRDLVVIRRRGYAITVDELEVGLTGVGAAVRGRDGTVVAALGVSGPTARLKARADQIGRLLVEQADTLSGLLRRRTRKEGAA